MAPMQKRKFTGKSFKSEEAYKEDHSKGKMLRFEDSLPRLPVPTLAETCQRYLKSIHPLLSKEEYAASEDAVAKFEQQAASLQDRLVEKAEKPEVKNWIADWWNEAAYLAYKDPIVPYVSYFYSFRDDRKRRNPAKRAAAIVTGALEFQKEVVSGTLEPEYMRKKPMAMSSYIYMFNTSRVAAEPADYPIQYPPAENQHIIAIRHNQFWKIPTHVDGKVLNTSELEQQFTKVYKAAQTSPPIGSLTSLPRDQGAKARANLLNASSNNAAALKEIEAASFVICLDAANPVTLEERARAYWHGDGANRWYDKPVQFIVNDNGTAGFMGEHSMMDGTPTHRLCDTVNALIVNEKLDFNNPTIRSTIPDPTTVKFDLDDQVIKDVSSAQQQFGTVIAAHELRVQAYQGYGKGMIKKFKCSPDAYVQMIIQLAYHKMYGKNRPTYESAATRKYQLGRTETTRTVSNESVAFCDAMANPEIGREECEQMFRKAVEAHVKYTQLASDGYGVDRHLFGLKKCLKDGEEVPDLYKDPAYTYSSSWFISSSQLSSEYFNGYGWSQVIDGGWGIAYMINENSIQFNVVSKHLGSERMSHYLNEAAGDIRDVLLPSLDTSKSSKL
ncbi:Carnitine O-acetyltransferase mitochondrial [Lithohypha guttulata]|uniref:Carnitine O-acetyltransferase, mitochondrial n=1 Tax=Lithohypha guttulata TaxID=1690604 RepID=A0AAN7T0G4_9EURO|nr:Carnitine O-acetyltransferase mitochondrial [Lithohypha guttulata]KAK5086450.1 Carnitine O-acetyltransferase mitochondrial [Lithohypha guttulata]